MSTETPALVGATFGARTSAAAAADALVSRGLAPANVLAAVWSGDRYVIESTAADKMGDALRKGGLLGGGVGFVVAGIIALAIWTSVSAIVAFTVTGVVGAAAGAVIGGYVGLNQRRRLLWSQRDWAHISLGEGHVLLVVGVDRPDDTEAILADHGGTVVEPVHPE